MGKGGMSHGETKDGQQENMAAWLLGVNTLKIQPFKLPPLGTSFLLSSFHPQNIHFSVTMLLIFVFGY